MCKYKLQAQGNVNYKRHLFGWILCSTTQGRFSGGYGRMKRRYGSDQGLFMSLGMLAKAVGRAGMEGAVRRKGWMQNTLRGNTLYW